MNRMSSGAIDLALFHILSFIKRGALLVDSVMDFGLWFFVESFDGLIRRVHHYFD